MHHINPLTSLPDLALSKILNHLCLKDTCNLSRTNKAVRSLVKHEPRFVLQCQTCDKPVANALCSIVPQYDDYDQPCTVFVDGDFSAVVVKAHAIIQSNISLDPPPSGSKTIMKCRRDEDGASTHASPRTIQLQVVHRLVYCSCGVNIGWFVDKVVPDQFSKRVPTWQRFARVCKVCGCWCWSEATVLTCPLALSETHTSMPRNPQKQQDIIEKRWVLTGCQLRLYDTFKGEPAPARRGGMPYAVFKDCTCEAAIWEDTYCRCGALLCFGNDIICKVWALCMLMMSLAHVVMGHTDGFASVHRFQAMYWGGTAMCC